MALSQGIVARVLGIDVFYQNFNLGRAQYLPQRIAVIGQGSTIVSYSTDKKIVNSGNEVGQIYGYGSPLHLACRQLLPSGGQGIQGIPVTVYPLVDDGSGIAASGEIDIAGIGTIQIARTGRIIIGGIYSATVLYEVGDNGTAIALKIKNAIDAIPEMPVTTGVIIGGILPVVAKWKGESGNQITIDISEINLSPDLFPAADTNLTGGLINPDVQDALDKTGNTWETIILNCLNYDDLVTNQIYSDFGEERWNQIVKRPLMVASGCVDDFLTRTAITDATASKTQRTNFLVQSIGSRELPFVIVAQGLVNDIAQKANDKPAHNYIGELLGLHAGPDDVQEDLTTRNNAIKLGASTNEKKGSIAILADTVTFYHPDGEEPPAYRYVVDIVKLQNVVYNLDIVLESLKGKPLLPDDTPTNDPDAVQPKGVRTILSNLADSLATGRSAIIAEPEFTRQNLTVEISSSNPKRLDGVFPIKLSGNVEVISVDVPFSFYFGE